MIELVRRGWNWGMSLGGGTLVKFLGVGGLCFVLTLVINYALKFTVLNHKPVIAFLIATIATTILSYFLNRRWTFGQNIVGIWNWDMLRFAIVSAIGIGLNSAPLWISRYVFGLASPHVTVAVQEVSDFIAGPIVGTIIAMAFRYWAMDRWVFGRPAATDAIVAESGDAVTTGSIPVPNVER